MPYDPTGYVSHEDELHRSQTWKRSCRVATTANITISTALNNGDSLDGVTLATGDRVLVKDQSTGSQNGIYVVGASPGRAFDMDQDATTSVIGNEVVGAVIIVREGTANAGTMWRCTNTGTPILGTTALTFAQFGGATTAASVSVADAGGYFTGTNIETVLQELASKDIGYTAHGNTGSTETFDALTGWHSATLNAATVTATFTGATSGLVSAMVLELAQDPTGGRLVTWPGSVVWPGGTAPTLSTADSAVDILTFFSRDGGTTWYGFMAGGGGSALTIKDEGSSLATPATSIDFVGAGVTASGSGAAKTVTIPGTTPSDVSAHAHIVSEAHLSNGSTTTYTLDQTFEPGTVIAWNTTSLARLGVTEAEPDQATVSAAGSSGDTIQFDYATPIV
jgi:hypothetical protein